MPTYDDFLKDLAKSGVNFSQYDLETAQGDPSFGYSLLKYKNDVKNASTPEARALANSGAESLRAQYGYSGGADGSQYIPLSSATNSASYLNQYMRGYDDRRGYDNLYDQNLQGVLNYAPFSYNAETDPLYQNYKEQYTRNGQMAMQDTLGQVSARTGGLASSYAATAADQAYNSYMQQLSDRIPELYQLAYQQYADEYNRKVNNLNLLDSARSTEYGRWQDDQSKLLNAYNIAASSEAAASRSRGGSSIPAPETPEPISAALYQQILNGDAATAAQALTTYWDRLTTSQRNTLAREAGIPATMVRDGIGNNADDVSALLELMNPQAPVDGLATDINNNVKDYGTAKSYLSKYGLDPNSLMDKSSFNKAQSAYVKQFNGDYAEYLKMQVYKALT